MTSVAQSVATAASEYTEPIRAAVNDKVRDVRRAIVAGRHAVQDCADVTAVQLRRRPFVSLGAAAGAGMLVGSLIGFMLGHAAQRRILK